MVRYLLNLAQGEEKTPDGLGNNFPDADAIIWTLTIDTIPVYAIKPLDVFGLGFYLSLVLALWHQEVFRLDPARLRLPQEAHSTPIRSATFFRPRVVSLACRWRDGWKAQTRQGSSTARCCRRW
jgi:hypothetical protein